MSDDAERPWMPGPDDMPFPVTLLNPHGTRHLAFGEGQWFRLWQDRAPEPLGGDGAIRQRPSDIDIIIKHSLIWAARQFPHNPRAAQLIDEIAVGAKRIVWHFADLAGAPVVTRRGMRRAVWLRGWSRYSIWGYDTGMGSYFAQLYPDDDPERGDGEPMVWISGVPVAITSMEDLASRVAAVTHVPTDLVLAMMKAEPGSAKEAHFAKRARP